MRYRTQAVAYPYFVVALLTLFVALLTVSVHCYSVAREKPVSALRYE